VKEVGYLGYRFRKGGAQEAHVEERVKKAMGVMRQVWGIGKRRFGGDWERRMKIFEWLVRSVVASGRRYGDGGNGIKSKGYRKDI